MITTTYYKCDPEKNTLCKKTRCALVKKRGRKPGECEATADPACAVLDADGKPVIAFVVMRGEDDGTD